MFNKVNSVLENKAITLFNFFLLLQPFLDLTTSFLIHNNISTHIIFFIKILFLLFCLYYIIIIKKESIKYIIFIFIYSIIFTLVNVFTKKSGISYLEIESLVKVIYFPIILTFVLILFKDNKFNIKNLFITLIIYLLFIFIPGIFNIGYDSYLYDKVGNVGFFYSANAVGSIISMIAPLFIFYLIKNKKVIYLILFLLLYLYVLFNLGTKAPILTCLFIILYFALYILINLIKQKKYRKIIILIITLVLGIILLSYIIPLTPFYKNLIIHANNKGISKLSDLLTFEKLDEYIFSARLSFLIDSFKVFFNSTIIQKLFGIGYIINDMRFKTSEMDYFVTLIHHGIIGFIVIYYKYFKSLFIIFKKYLGLIKKNFFDIQKSGFIISIVVSIMNALLVGHVLDVPSVSIFVTVIIGIASFDCKEKE